MATKMKRIRIRPDPKLIGFLNPWEKTADFRHFWRILSKNFRRFIAGDIKALFIFCLFNFLHIDPTNYFCLCKFFAKSLKSEGERI
jgi:hypothetical protein